MIINLKYLKSLTPEEEMATRSSILAWKIPWTEEPGGLQTVVLQRVRQDWVTEHTHTVQSLHHEVNIQLLLGHYALDYFLRQKSESESLSVVADSLWHCGLYSPWNFPGQNTGVGSLSLLQGIFPTQGLNPGLLHCREMLYQLSHKRNPKILKWLAYPFSSGSSQPRNRTGVSCIAGGFFTNWAIKGN